MRVTSLGFETDLMVRRLEASAISDAGDHIIVRTKANPDYYWGNFVLAGADPGNHERWLAVFAREFPDATHVAIGLDGALPPGEQPPGELLAGYRAAGLETEVSNVLVATGMDAPVSGAACRPLHSDEDWAQVLDVSLNCADRDTEQHRQFLRRRIGQRRELSRSNQAVWFGAVVDGRVRATLGLVSDGNGLARYQDVETHPDFRRRGLARSLVATAGRYGLAKLGARKLVIVADPGYHAIDLYRALGFCDAQTQLQLTKPSGS
jgi:ribosomal protein S18 acetylase RimI-like enzyme